MGGANEVGLLAAADFAARKHKGQRRNDAEATPYINHPIAVAALLARVAGVKDLLTLQGALLHDTIEDTETSAEEIEVRFGKAVRRLVLEVTDDKTLPRPDRKRLQVERAAKLTSRARLIRVADKICNLDDMNFTNPGGWSLERKLGYLDWSVEVIGQIRGIHPGLEKLFDTIVAEKRQLLATPQPAEAAP